MTPLDENSIDEIRATIPTEVSDDDITLVFIPRANALYSTYLGSQSLNVDVEHQIRLLLCAHYIATARDIETGALLEHRTDTIYTRVAGGIGSKDMFGPGLRQTRYGQDACDLDPTGSLSDIAGVLGNAEIGVVEQVDPANNPKRWW